MSQNFLYPSDFDEYPDPREYYDPNEASDETDAQRKILDYPLDTDELDFD